MNWVFPEMLPYVAVIVTGPDLLELAVANPIVLISAIELSDEPHVTDVVISCVVLSEYVPVAVNCLVPPLLTFVLDGVTAMDVKVVPPPPPPLLVTVSRVFPEIVPDVAVIVVEPAATPVANPPLLMVATPVFDEFHATDAVRSCVLLFEYVPVAINCCVLPVAIVGFTGVTAMEVKVVPPLLPPFSPPPPLPPLPPQAEKLMMLKIVNINRRNFNFFIISPTPYLFSIIPFHLKVVIPHKP
jgi:hypothetical protein